MVALPNIGLFDLGLGIVYLLIIYFVAYRYQQFKKVKNPAYNYFLVGLSAKIMGALAFILISLYYYEKGDTFLYFQIAEDIRNNLFLDFGETTETLFTSYSNLSERAFNPIAKYNYYYERTSNWDFGRIVFLFNLLSFGSYIACSVLMATISFIGLWLGYITICKLYPRTDRLMLVPFFLIPTALIWGSGILKDTLVMGCVGLLIFSFAEFFIFRKRYFMNLLLIAITICLLQILRPILMFVLVPTLFIWGVLHLTELFKTKRVRVYVRVFALVGMLVAGFIINQNVLSETSKYRTNNLMKTLYGFQSFHSMEVFAEGQNVYTIGDGDGIMKTPKEVIKAVPSAINVTFFRPYVWEVNNAPMLLGSIESLLLLLGFIYTIIISRPYFFKGLFKNNELLVMLFFSIVYAFLVGASSYNFGALSRYKIPANMLFIIAMFIVCKESYKLKGEME